MTFVSRTEKRTKRSILVKFQPWLIFGGVLLNVVATGSAALSAYYTSQQAELATKAVDQQSKNQAFSDFIKAKEDLCAVSLVQWDQMDGLDGPSDFSQKKPGKPRLLFVDYDAMMLNHSDKRTEEYSRRANELSAVVESKLTQLSIWLPKEQYRLLSGTGDNGDSTSYREEYLLSSGQVAETTAVAQQFACRREIEKAVTYYTGIGPEGDDQIVGDGVVVVPLSKAKSIEQVIKSWGEGGESSLVLDDLKARGVLDWDVKQREAAQEMNEIQK